MDKEKLVAIINKKIDSHWKEVHRRVLNHEVRDRGGIIEKIKTLEWVLKQMDKCE